MYPSAAKEAMMGRIISKARQLRLNLQAKLGRDVTIEEVAEEIGVDRRALMRIELGRARLYDAEVMGRLGDYYHAAGIDTSDLLRYDSNNKKAFDRPMLTGI
jgi:transcriptional regulator with XRE-family HTH domain